MKMTNKMALGLLLSASLPCFAAYYWRPSTDGQTWADAVWSTDVSAVGSLVFLAGEDAVFDGTEAATDRTVTLAAAVQAGTVTFGGADYALTGAGELKADRLVKQGAGTLTLGAALADGSALSVKGGTVKLDWTGVDLETKTTKLGKGTVVTVDGGTVDLNVPKDAMNKAANDLTRAAVFKIKGAGVDGRGALVNDNDESNWNCALTRLELLGDATVGGKSRYDLRAGAPNSDYAMGELTGPKDATLTVKTERHNPFGLSVVGTTISLGGIVVDGPGSQFQVEDNLAWDVPNGITLMNGGEINLRYAVLPDTVPLKVPAGQVGGFLSSAATGRTQGTVTVEERAILELRAGENFFIDGPLVNNGRVVAKGWGVFLNGPISGSGTFGNDGDNIRFTGGVQSPEETLHLDLSGGIDLGQPGIEGYPHFKAIDGTVGGGVWLRARGGTFSNEWDGFINSTQDKSTELICYNDGRTDVTTHLDHVSWRIPFLRLGKAGGTMHLHLMNESSITINETAADGRGGFLVLSQDAGGAKGATVTLDPGTRLTVLSTDADGFCLGQWSRATNSHARIIADGATVAAPNGYLRMGKDIPYAEFIAKNGANVSMKGLEVRSTQTPVDYLNGLAQVHLASGATWSIGEYGIKSLMAYPDMPALDLADGTFRATADWPDNSDWLQVAFGEHPGQAGRVTFDLGGHNVQFSAAVGGVSDVTVTGGGTLNMERRIQSVPTGKWTVDAGVTANLKGMAGFAGGLEVAAGATAAVSIAGTSACEFGMVTRRSFDVGRAWKDGPYAMLDTTMDQLHTHWEPGPMQNTAFVWAGQFYVPADQAGTWYFAGNYDDNILLEIDGAEAFYNADWNKLATTSFDVGAGWHDFRVVAYDGTGGQGVSTVDETKAWANAGLSLGWSATAPANALDPSSYQRFDPTTLQMRPRPAPAGTTGVTGVRWQTGRYQVDTAQIGLATWQEYGYKLYEHVDIVTNTLQMINSTAWGNASMSRFSGYFHVDDDKAGDWTFTGQYDDNIVLRVDDEELFMTKDWQNRQQKTVALSAGWHAFDIRVGDGAGGVGPSGLTDDNGVAAGLTAKAPNEPAKAFDERNFRLVANSYQLGIEAGAGLGGTTTLNEGATLVNDAAKGFCPIYGRLAGAGTLQGAFRMAGGTLVVPVADMTASTPELKDADADFLAGLGGIELQLTERPRFTRLPLYPAYGLTEKAADGVAVTATFSGAEADKLARKYEGKFKAQVVDGRLTVVNLVQPITIFVR